MNIVPFSAMKTWHARFEEEHRLVFELVRDGALAISTHKPRHIDDSIAVMRLVSALLDISSAYLIMRNWIDGAELHVDRLDKLDASPWMAPTGEQWFDDLCQRLWARRTAAASIMRFVRLETARPRANAIIGALQ